MYNKLFTKILDSSIWLESDTTRLVWLTLIAAMDEAGFCSFASVANLAHRARVELTACNAAVTCLESPDLNSSDPDNEGRRIERVPGGWMVLNAEKYKELVNRTVQREKTRLRVQKFREKQGCNADVTPVKRSVTPSETYTETSTNTQTRAKARKDVDHSRDADFDLFWTEYPKKEAKAKARESFDRVSAPISTLLDSLKWQKNQSGWTKDGGQFIPQPATWLNQKRWEDEKPTTTNGPTTAPISAHNNNLNRDAVADYQNLRPNRRFVGLEVGADRPGDSAGNSGAVGDAQ